MVTWPWALAVLAVGFVGGLAAGRALDKFGTGDEIPEGFRYIPQPTDRPDLRVVDDGDWLAADRRDAAVRGFMERRAGGERL